LAGNTVVIFMTDNGPQYDRYTGGLRGRKSLFYEGGIRVPFFIRCPGVFSGGRKAEHIAAHIDVAPTLLDMCGVRDDSGSMDGVSVLPLIREENPHWSERTLFFQGNQGIPELYNQCAVLTQRYKLVNGKELYDLAADAGEQHDIAAKHPETVSNLRREYEAWFANLAPSRGYEPQRIWIGDRHENPVRLTPQDWRGERSRFVQKDSLGYWLLEVRSGGKYEATVQIPEKEPAGTLRFTIGNISFEREISSGEAFCVFGPFELERGNVRLDTWMERNDGTYGVRWVEMKLV
jgi:hypothetical protein